MGIILDNVYIYTTLNPRLLNAVKCKDNGKNKKYQIQKLNISDKFSQCTENAKNTFDIFSFIQISLKFIDHVFPIILFIEFFQLFYIFCITYNCKLKI